MVQEQESRSAQKEFSVIRDCAHTHTHTHTHSPLTQHNTTPQSQWPPYFALNSTFKSFLSQLFNAQFSIVKREVVPRRYVGTRLRGIVGQSLLRGSGFVFFVLVATAGKIIFLFLPVVVVVFVLFRSFNIAVAVGIGCFSFLVGG